MGCIINKKIKKLNTNLEKQNQIKNRNTDIQSGEDGGGSASAEVLKSWWDRKNALGLTNKTAAVSTPFAALATTLAVKHGKNYYDENIAPTTMSKLKNLCTWKTALIGAGGLAVYSFFRQNYLRSENKKRQEREEEEEKVKNEKKEKNEKERRENDTTWAHKRR